MQIYKAILHYAHIYADTNMYMYMYILRYSQKRENNLYVEFKVHGFS